MFEELYHVLLVEKLALYVTSENSIRYQTGQMSIVVLLKLAVQIEYQAGDGFVHHLRVTDYVLAQSWDVLKVQDGPSLR